MKPLKRAQAQFVIDNYHPDDIGQIAFIIGVSEADLTHWCYLNKSLLGVSSVKKSEYSNLTREQHIERILNTHI
jgi:hypothetical protein